MHTATPQAFCHANGIIHRDLKPENVLLSKKDDIQSAKLIDFGFAAAFEQKMGLRLHAAAPQLNTLCGTVGYLAPEVINKKVTCECRGRWGRGIGRERLNESPGCSTSSNSSHPASLHPPPYAQTGQRSMCGPSVFSFMLWSEVTPRFQAKMI